MNYFTTVKFISMIPPNKDCKGFKIVEYLQFSKFIILINLFKVNGLISLIYITGSSLYFTTSLFFYFLTYKKNLPWLFILYHHRKDFYYYTKIYLQT